MTLVILHFRPKHLYPPLLNIIAYLEENNVNYKLISCFKFRNTKSSGFGKLLNSYDYFIYTIKCIFCLIMKPKNILCIESISAIPLRIYQILFGLNKMKVFIHYHEYFSMEDYKEQSFFERLGRKVEIPILEKALWISHTNKNRLQFFKNDFPALDATKLHIMPNYPSKLWQNSSLDSFFLKNEKAKSLVRILHIGSLSFEGMYLQEALDYFGNNENYQLDFYSHTKDENIIAKFKNYNNVKFMGSLKYENLPKLKGNYDVGLVLYNGSSLNFIYNAPNKIFEYLALNLDVWCSDKLITAHDYIIEKTYPKMILIDYKKLAKFDFQKAIDKRGLYYKQSPYFCEDVYDNLLEKMDENSNT